MGGAERCLLELAEGLVRGFDADVEVVLPAPGPLAAALAGVGARTVVVRNYGWATLRKGRMAGRFMALANLSATHRIARRLVRSRPDLVATNSLINPAGAYAAELAGLPHVWLVHEYGDLDHGYRFTLGIGRTLAEVGRLSQRVVTCSHALARRVAAHVPVYKLEVAYYAITLGASTPTSPPPGATGAPQVLLLGRKHPGKGQAEAIRAVARLRERGSAATLRLVGEPSQPDVRDLERLSLELGATGWLELAPPVDDPIAEIDACDVLLLCSRSEAFGRVLVEAMKRDRPVIAARAGGAEELVTLSGGGLLYSPGDDGALADAIDRVGRDPGEARRLANAGRSWADEHCTLEAYASAFVEAVQRPPGDSLEKREPERHRETR